MAKLTLSDIVSIVGNEGAAITLLNNNWAAIEAAVENTLSRDGTNPNMMEADLDMNTNDILNVGTLGAEEINATTVNTDTLNADTANVGTANVDELWVGGFQFDADGELRNFRLRSLIDVDVTGLTTGDFLKWDGSFWVPDSISASVSWGFITGTLSDQTDLQAELDGKADAVHSHAISDVTGLQAALDGKSNVGHAHTLSDITDYVAYTDENAQDAVAAMLVAGTGMSGSYNDGANTYTFSTTITQYTDEMARDAIGAALVAGTGIGVSVDDGGDTITVSSTITQYTDEMAQDAIGAMVDTTLEYVDATPLLRRAAITGDIAIAAGANSATLATVNANTGSFGSATQVGTFTVNGKGLITAASNTSISVTSSAVTDFTEAAQDAINSLLAAGTHTNLTYSYNDAGNAFSITIDDVFAFNAGDVFTGAVGFPDGSLGSPSIYRSAQTAVGVWFGASRVSISPNASTQHDFTSTAYTLSKSSGLVRNVLESGDNVAEYLFTAGNSNANPGATLRVRHNRGGSALQSGDAAGSVDFEAFDGSAYQTVSRMVARTLENTTSTQYGAAFRLSTVAQGSSTLATTLDVDLTNGMAYAANIFLDQNRLFQLRTSTIAGALTGAQGKLGYFTDAGSNGRTVVHNGSSWQTVGSGGLSTKSNTTNFNITPLSDSDNILLTGVIAAARNATVLTTNAFAGMVLRITRTAASTGAFNWNIVNGGAGAGTLKGLATSQWCEIVYDGTNWQLLQFGSL